MSMQGYITPSNEYYEGDQLSPFDIPVSSRPSWKHKYNMETSEWEIDPLKEIEDLKMQLAATDAGFTRFAEDVFEALKAKNYLDDTDLPEESRTKYNNRKSLRENI